MKKLLTLILLVSTISASKKQLSLPISQEEIQKYITISGHTFLASVGVVAATAGCVKSFDLLVRGAFSKPSVAKILFRVPYACILMGCSASLLKASKEEGEKAFSLFKSC